MDHDDSLLSARECDFAEALAALHELIGTTVRVSVGPARGPGTFMTAVGRVLRGYELAPSERSSVAFEIGDATLLFSHATLVRAWREEHLRGPGVRCRIVALELRIGVEVEVEELEAGREPG